VFIEMLDNDNLIELISDTNNLSGSIKQEIEKRTKECRERLESKQEKLNDTTKKLKMFDKMSIKLDIKLLQEDIKNLSELFQAIGTLNFSNTNKYNLPTELKSQFDELSTLLEKEEVNNLKEVINNCFKNVNEDKKERLEEDVKKAQKLLNQLNIGSNRILIYDNNNEYTGKTISFNNAIEEIRKKGLIYLNSKYLLLLNKTTEVELNLNDKIMLDTLEEMIKTNQLEQNQSSKDIIENFKSLKESFQKKAKIDKILLVISHTLSSISQVKEVEFSNVKTYLEKLEKNYQQELDNTNKYLNKFDFEYVKKKIKEKKEKESLNDKIKRYQRLSYELEKMKDKTPNNSEEIHKIQEEMQGNARTSGLTPDQIENAFDEGRRQYQKESYDKDLRIKAINEGNEKEKEIRREVMRQMREYAIQELKASGAFDDIYEFRNGDAYSKPIDEEKLIQRKIAELEKIVEMTPEQRGLEDLKRQGTISSDTRLEDLSSSQLNDFKIGYSDSSYGFISDYKKLKSIEQNKNNANNIYKEYIKYRAELEDKNNFLKFSEYAKKMHNIDNMYDSMVDEDLKEEIRSMSR